VVATVAIEAVTVVDTAGDTAEIMTGVAKATEEEVEAEETGPTTTMME